MRVSDYIFERLAEHYKVKDVFLLTGGGAMHLNDAVGRCKKLNYICNFHEQACAIAAEGYARAKGDLAVVNVTSGPGGTNTMTGVIGQWLDSVPVLYISGQVKFETTISSCPKIGLRQLGDQEINTVDIVKPVTKYAVMVTDPNSIKYHLDRAVYLAKNGRPGPVWLDVPLNVQGAQIDEKNLKSYDPKEDVLKVDQEKIKKQVAKLVGMMKKAERPIILAGQGVRIAKGQQELLKLLGQTGIPAVVSINGFDLIPTDHSQNIGKIGSFGDRPGNFAIQNSDLMISIGSRNNIRQVSFNWTTFARAAKKVSVDIDSKELKKTTLKLDLAVNSDAKYFLEELLKQLRKEKLPSYQEWLKWCQDKKKRYPTILLEYKKEKVVNPYYFLRTLTELMKDGATLVAGNGTAFVVGYQSYKVKKNQRVIWNSGCATMGYDLPAAIGASLALGKKEVVCVAGDGSFQMNMQEMQTVINNKLPIKIFYLNNEGYASIKITQDTYFADNRVGCCPKTGIILPDIIKIAKAYGIKTAKISNYKNLKQKVKRVLDMKGAVLCEVLLPPNHRFIPKLSSEKKPDGTMVSKPIEDMWPFLDREEFKSNMIIKPLDE